MEQTENKRRRGIYLLPNLFTTAAMFGGFYAIIAAMNGAFEAAAIAVFIAMVLDGLDGRVARLTQTSSDFGAEYDSLSDMVSFGLAPALVMYQWSLVSMKTMGWEWAGKLGWLAAFFYATTAALRLARFNTMVGTSDKRFFQGLPSPTAAALMMGCVWVMEGLGVSGEEVRVPAFLLTLVAGGLMVSNVSYYSFKEIDIRHKVPFLVLLAIVISFMLFTIDPAKVLFGMALVYTASGPCLTLWRRYRKYRARRRA
jgi:CDP-diacylglycerol--serine O-phosphatidyltransferase